MTGALRGLSQDRLDTMCLLLQIVLDHKLVQNICLKFAFVQLCCFWGSGFGALCMRETLWRTAVESKYGSAWGG
jgi:hypothetical protein